MLDEQEIAFHRSRPRLIVIITTVAVLCVPHAGPVSFSVLPAAATVMLGMSQGGWWRLL